MKPSIFKTITLCLLVVSQWSVAKQLTQYTARNAQKANELIQSEQFEQAAQLLEGLSISNPYDKAFISRMLGVVYWQNGNIDKAIGNIAKAVDSGLLEDEQAWTTKKMLADLYLNEQQFSNANKYYYELVESVPDNQNETEIWFRLAQSHYQELAWSKVLTALSKYKATLGTMNKQALSLKLGSQLQLKLYSQAIDTLELLIELEPDNASWWHQLASLHLQINEHKQALDTLALAKLQGVQLSDSDTRLLAQLYAKQGIPERAAIEISQLTETNSDVELLVEQATYWQMAKEWDKAIEVWLAAAEKKNQYYWNAALILNQQGEYQQALQQLDKLPSDVLRDKITDIALVKARAFYKLGEFESALIEAKRANNSAQSTSERKQAESWLTYLNQLQQVSEPS